tara:strand:- start:180 stop:413 length:234 start_codon:yes stop_codon:yes gene_type:complete
MEYTIDKNIPVPRKRTIDSAWGSIADSMEVGDSILVPTRGKATGLVHVLRRRDFRAPTRVEKGGIRVWKLLKEATYK